MQKINFVKMHGLGNDFVIIDNRYNKINISKKIISQLSDRKSGAGCDQLITVNDKHTSQADARIEIFNPSGDKAEACGNGARCVAKLLFEEFNKKEVKIDSDSGTLVAVKKDNINISVNLGKLSTHWEKIPLSKKVDTKNITFSIDGLGKGIAINIGNPHIVFIEKNIEKINLELIGPLIENDELFPNKTNVEVIEIINSKKIKMRVWERGVGITMACGTGACASVYAGQIKKLLEQDVEVEVEKGSLYISIINDEAIMSGPAEISYHGTINL